MTDETTIQEQIHNNGAWLYESIEHDKLHYLVGEIMRLNKYYVRSRPNRVGAEEIMRNGFTSNQISWIEDIRDELDSEEKK